MVWPAPLIVVGLGDLLTAIEAGVLAKVHTTEAPALSVGCGNVREKLVPEPLEGLGRLVQDHVVA